jgi:hypothetical protein
VRLSPFRRRLSPRPDRGRNKRGRVPGLKADPILAAPPVSPDRPVMGFNPYNTFGTSIDQAEIVEIVRAMAANGMRAAGYHYVILDDGWQGTRTSGGQMTADPSLFRCGIQQLAAFVHAEGFRFGIYTSPSVTSCSGRVGGWAVTSAAAGTTRQGPRPPPRAPATTVPTMRGSTTI